MNRCLVGQLITGLLLPCLLTFGGSRSAYAQTTEASQLLAEYGKRDISVHDPSSLVKCDDEYWLYSTGMLIKSYRSNDLETWTRGPAVFDAMPSWVKEVVPDQRGHFWAPDIIRIGGRYLLYYSVSTFGKQTSAIALATNVTLDPESPDYSWIDQGIVVQTDESDDFNAIDPALFLTKDNELFMSFGSYWSGIKLIRLEAETGLRSKRDGKVYPLAWNREIEAAHIHEHDGYYYLYVNWGKCCRGIESTYEIRVGRSRSITGPYLDREGKDLKAGGGTMVLASDGPFIGPGHANVTDMGERLLFHCHFYDATNRGRSRLAVLKVAYGDDGWPTIETGTRVSLK